MNNIVAAIEYDGTMFQGSQKQPNSRTVQGSFDYSLLKIHKKQILSEGDLLQNEALEHHAIESLEDSKLLILTRGLRGGDDYESDTFKLDKPLL